jgi:membrane associated rhomboid family serine protease
MFPIRDHNPSSTTPFVTYALIAINVVVFVSYWPLFSNPAALEAFFARWALTPARAQPLGFVTSMFLHGGVMHLLGNMLFLWIFGDNLEDEMGHVGYLLFYLAGGVGAELAQVVSEPSSAVPMVGASGAIAAVMGGYLLMFPRARVDVLIILVIIFRVVPVAAWLMLGLWLGLQVFAGATVTAGAGGVAYWAHAGGFLVGFLLTLPVWFRLGGPEFWRQTHGRPPHPAANYRVARTSIPTAGRRRR